jgi:soluble lytic murein transglycosylase-like protein
MDSVRILWLLLSLTAMAQTQASIDRQRASVELQKESIRKQMTPAPKGLAVPSIEAPCDPLPVEVVAPLIENAAGAQKLEASLLRAVIQQESGYRPCALSAKGATGLMQLMPATAGDLLVRNPFDPKENIEAGARYLKQLIERYKGNLEQALGAYNAGPAAVDQAGGIPNIPETREYVKAILDRIAITRIDPPSIPKPKPIEN